MSEVSKNQTIISPNDIKLYAQSELHLT